jgi:branched-subunit amino acid ABC-type transport system permease component
MAFPGFWLWWKSGERRAEFFVAAASTLSIFLFNSSSIMWWGGFSIGPRYLLPMMPFMALPIIFIFREWMDRVWVRVAVAALSFWSLVATWGLTLAEQAFPSDTIRNPLAAYALPNWLAGNIARNLGTILGFKGVSSLLPLVVALMLITLTWWVLSRQLMSERSVAASVGSPSVDPDFATGKRTYASKHD